MIGASNSPMNMFTGGGNEAFQRGMVIGNANSPANPMATALKGVLDKYNAHLSAQTEQANKLEQIRATGVANHPLLYDAQGNIKTSTGVNPDYQGPRIIHDDKTNKDFYANDTLDETTGMTKTSWAPVSINAPADPMKTVEGIILDPMIEQMKKEAAAKSMGAPNVIQQGAGVPAVNAAPSTVKMPTPQEIKQARAAGYRGYDQATGQWVK